MNHGKSNPRSGTVLICVLACLGIVTVLVITTMQNSLRGRREVRMQRQLLQTEFLCEAGVKRAVQRLKRSPEYKGEKWLPKLGTTSFENSTIEIRIEPAKENANSLRAEVVASIADSANSNNRMQRSHTFFIDHPTITTETK
ncbi:MAG TPA: hypothetical protein VM260_19555 [Pirellula sp.]|nr:hypothetical protein [Pirellula sp.]